MDRLWLASNMQDEVANIKPIWDIFKDIVDGWLVVDSGSTDGTQDILNELVGDRLKLVQSDMIKVNGYGFSRTKLVELSDAEWVLIFDGDERMLEEDVDKIHPLINKFNYCDMIWLPRCHYQNWEMTKVEYGSMDKVGSDWKEAIRINPDFQPRLIHRKMVDGKSKVQFFRRVHERIEGITQDYSSRYNPVIRHFGWMKTDERKKQIASLCDVLYHMDLDKKEYVDTYELENVAGTANVLNPEYLRVMQEVGIQNFCERAEFWGKNHSAVQQGDSIPCPFEKYIDYFYGKKVLEIGPGEARQYKFVKDICYEYSIADISQEVLDHPIYSSGGRFSKCEGRYLLKDYSEFYSRFEVIHFWYVLHHILPSELPQFVEFLNNNLAEGGHILFNTPYLGYDSGNYKENGIMTTPYTIDFVREVFSKYFTFDVEDYSQNRNSNGYVVIASRKE